MKIAFLASPKPAAQETLRQFTARYGQADIAAADYLVSIGGDGTALKALRTAMLGSRQPVYAMRLAGSVGFLANEPELADLPGRMQSARKVMLRPLVAEAGDVRGAIRTVYGIKDVVLIRERLQAAKLRLTIQGREPGLRLSGDGLLVATAIGSTGYNRSAGGPRLAPDSSLLAITGLAVRQTFDWANTVASDSATLDIEVEDPEHRPVRLETSFENVPGIRRVRLFSSPDIALALLFDGTGV